MEILLNETSPKKERCCYWKLRQAPDVQESQKLLRSSLTSFVAVLDPVALSPSVRVV